MTIRNCVLSALACVGLLLTVEVSQPAAQAQTLLVPTTLSTAVTTSSVKTITVASATSFATGYIAYVDREALEVQSVSGSNITVRRGAVGTNAAPHASGAYVFVFNPAVVGPFFAGSQPSGSCTRGSELYLPRIDIKDGLISDCLGGQWQIADFAGGAKTSVRFRVYAPEPGGTLYTAINTSGTTLAATTTYCTESFLPESKLLTGVGILQGTTVGTDKWIGILYDSGGTALTNSTTAGTATATASTYLPLPFGSKYFAVGPADYFVCFQTNGTTDTARMIITGVNDNLLTKGQTGGTFATIPTLTVPTGFTTAVGPYIYLY